MLCLTSQKRMVFLETETPVFPAIEIFLETEIPVFPAIEIFSRNGGCFSRNRDSSSSSSNGGSSSSSSNGGSSARRQAFDVDNVDQLGGEVVDLLIWTETQNTQGGTVN
ncbi:unnamed protein product [Ambrosiozyma monospora]|uniref:Unnamed protein product n=1 Tax=Ambrosiozyma monospora TaxID=43982 RepID=A0A9W6TB09_AMBMO|nr:unnamed protein product [Ambrosiozyma monospora]